VIKTLALLSLALAVPAFSDSGIKMMFNLQTNSAGCFPVLGQMFGCLPKEMRQAGVMAIAKTEDTTITGFRFTVTATLPDGSTVTKSVLTDRATETPTVVVIWIASELSGFSNVKVFAVGLRDSDQATSGTVPGIEY